MMTKRIFKSLPLLMFMFLFNTGAGLPPSTPKEVLNEKIVQANVIDIEARLLYEKALKRNKELKDETNKEF